MEKTKDSAPGAGTDEGKLSSFGSIESPASICPQGSEEGEAEYSSGLPPSKTLYWSSSDFADAYSFILVKLDKFHLHR